PGQYQLRASASSVKLGAGGSVYLTIDVPDFAKDPIALSGIAVGYADGARVPVGHSLTTPAAPAPGRAAGPARATAPGRAAGPAGTGRVAAPPAAPASVVPFEPSLNREFEAKDTLRVFAEIARGTPPEAVKAAVEIINANDKVMSTSDVVIAATARNQ